MEHSGAIENKNLKLAPEIGVNINAPQRTQSKLDADMKNMQSQPIFEVQNVSHDEHQALKNRRRTLNLPPKDPDDEQQEEEEEEEDEEAEADEDGEEAIEEE